MHRRSFVRILTAGGAACAVSPSLAGCASGPSAAYQAWNGPSPALADEDVRLRIVSYGLLAPSVANLQPWWVSLKHPGILVALEPHRLLRSSDPDRHQAFVSLGAFVEALRLAAGEYGLAASVAYFPSGEPAGENDLDLPVARLDLSPEGSRDPLAAQLVHRRTNRREYLDRRVGPAELASLAAAAPEGVSVRWFTSPEDRQRVSDAVLVATEASLNVPERYRETVAALRWSDQETESTRDGIPLRHLGLPAWSEWYERLVRSRATIADGGMKDRLMEMARRQTSSASAFGVLTTPMRGRSEELLAGAALLRVHLAATERGLAFQPLNAPLEGRMTLPAGILSDNDNPHALFRVGYADEVPPAPRRTLFEVVQL